MNWTPSKGDGIEKEPVSEEQTIAVLKVHKAGIPISDICRKYGISDATLYSWRNRYGGVEVSDACRLETLEDENRNRKKLLAELMLHVATLREALQRISEARFVESVRDLGDRREELLAATGGLIGLNPKTYRYASRRPDDVKIRERVKTLAGRRRLFG